MTAADRTRAQEAASAVAEAMSVLGRGVPIGAEITLTERRTGSVHCFTITVILEEPDGRVFCEVGQ